VKGRIHFFQKPGTSEYITALILYPTKEEPLYQANNPKALIQIIPQPARPWIN
jgi:hypothetical protein